MSSKGEETRARILTATSKLLAAQGYNGTGIKEILAESKAPRGSFYFHFPGGKEELACAALEASGAQWRERVLEMTRGAPSPSAAIDLVCDALADQLIESDFLNGCPIATVVLETAAQSDAIHKVTSAHFIEWRKVIASVIAELGIPAAMAPTMATLLLSSIEGALLLARAQRSRAPLDDIAVALKVTLAAVMGDDG